MTAFLVFAVLGVLGFALSVLAQQVGMSRKLKLSTVIGLALVLICTAALIQSCQSGPPNDRTTTDGPSEGDAASPGPAVLSQGTVAIGPGDFLNLETGEVGGEVEKPDIAYVEGDGGNDWLMPMSGGIERTASDAGADGCTQALSRPAPAADALVSAGDRWCVATGAGHVAAVAVLSRAFGSSDPGRLHFIVWDAPAPN